MKEPEIVAFFCQWCSYRGADLAGVSRLTYPSRVKILRIPCTGWLSPHLVLKAFQSGADGVLVSGCHPGECHYEHGNLMARARIELMRELLDLLGISKERLKIDWISAGEAIKVKDKVGEFYDRVKDLGHLEI